MKRMLRSLAIVLLLCAACAGDMGEAELEVPKWSLTALGNEELVAARLGYQIQRLPTVTIGIEAIRLDSLAEDDGGYGGGLWATWETPIGIDTTRWQILQGLEGKTYMGARIGFVDNDANGGTDNLVSILAGVTTTVGIGIEYQYAFDQSRDAADIGQHQVMLVVGPWRF